MSPHSERRSLQPHHDAVPETKTQEHKAQKRAEEACSTASDLGPDRLTRGRRCQHTE